MLRTIVFSLLNPLIWFILLALAAYVFKNNRTKKYCRNAAIILFLFFSNNYIANTAMSFYIPEQTFIKNKSYEVGIVLGGYASISDQTNRVAFYAATDRLLQAIYLYRKGIIKKIMLSGGTSNPIKQPLPEAFIVKDFLIINGIPERDIILEAQSKNTRENATLSIKLLKQKEIKGAVLLITSASHMRRAAKLFNRANQNFILHTFHSDYPESNKKSIFIEKFLPNPKAFTTWETLNTEMIGYIIQ